MNDALDPSPPVFEVVSFLNATIDLPRNDKFVSRQISGDLYEISFNPRKNYTEGGKIPASKYPLIRKGSKEWKDAVQSLRNATGKGNNFLVETQKDALELLKEGREGLTRRRSYWHDEMKDKGISPGKDSIVNEGYEYHLENEVLGTDGMNDLKHIKWYDYRDGTRKEGHIFYKHWI